MEDIYSFLRKLQTQIQAPPSYIDPEATGLMSVGTTYGYNDAVKGSPYESKYSQSMREVEPGLFLGDFQDPGKDKYSTLSAYYRIDPATGMATMEGDPFQTRQTSKRETVKDFLEHGVPLVAAAAAGGYAMNPAYGGMASAGTGATAGMEGFLSPELVGGSFGTGSGQAGLAAGGIAGGTGLTAGGGGTTLGTAGSGMTAGGSAATGLGSTGLGGGASVGSGLLSSLTSGEASPWLRAAAGLYGAYEGSQEQPGPATANQRTLDPRIDSRVFGPGGLMESADAQFQQNKATGQNETMVQAQDWLRGLLTSPEMQQGLRSQYNASQGLFNMGPNPFGKGWGG